VDILPDMFERMFVLDGGSERGSEYGSEHGSGPVPPRVWSAQDVARERGEGWVGPGSAVAAGGAAGRPDLGPERF